MRLIRYFFSVFILLSSVEAFCQQDVDFYVTDHYLAGNKILKVYKNVSSTYVFALAVNNKIYRVNINTKVVVDLSSEFASYNYFQFNDIVSPDDNELFIGTTSPDVIMLKNGTLSLLDASRGLQGNVRSIGLFLKNNGLGNTVNNLLIGTNQGLARYYFDTDQLNFTPEPHPIDIFEENFRVSIFGFDELIDDPRFTGVAINDWQGLYGGYVWNSPQFGITNTAFVDYPNLEFDFLNKGDIIDLFWGSAKGLFRIPLEYSNDIRNITQYLPDLNVNKINNIYGLTSFGSNYYKSNLLIGTNGGLYFSNSTASTNDAQVNLSFTHLDLLGNIKINDIQTSIASVSNIYYLADCEDAAWIASDDGIYTIKPDYAKYFNIKHVTGISFEGMDNSVSEAQLCPGDSLTATLDYNFIHGNGIQWFNGNNPILGQTNQNLMLKDSGDYYAVLYNSCENVHIETNHLKVKLITPVFTFNYPDTIRYCNGSSAILNTNGSSAYQYKWYKNDLPTGDTSSSLSILQPGKYKVEVSACPSSWVSSKEVEVEMVTIPVPQITADKAIYCAEDTAALSINIPTDIGYTINWYRNGNLLSGKRNLTTIKDTTGGSFTVIVNSNVSDCSQTSSPLQLAFIPSPVFTFNYPSELQYCSGTPVTLNATGNAGYDYRWYTNGVLNGDTSLALSVRQTGKYKIEESACPGSWVSSKEVQVNLVQLPVPVIKPDKPAYCVGDNATFTIAVPQNPSYTINWYRDSVLLTTNTNLSSLTTNISGNYTVLVVNNTVNTDGTTCSQTSAVQSLSFNPIPKVSIQKIIKSTICDGQTVFLLANYNGGSVKWSTGETTDQISVTTSGNYTATVTSPYGCQADTSIAVTFLPNPVFRVNDTSICTYKKQVISLTAPAGFSQYIWNGTPGGQTYQITQPQTVNLMVTDANGCQATQQIKVADQCPNIFIPNTFTPNGDGINDTWVIEGLDNDPTVLVRIFTRYGTMIFESKGYGTPWNGEYNGKKLPVGTYYYIISAKSGKQTFSGWVAIIY